MTKSEAYNEDATIGHREGKGRCGQYVWGEEWFTADDATHEHTSSPRARVQWREGYVAGYVAGASGDPSPCK